MDSTLPFTQKVIRIVSKIPYGAVASYGQIALYCGAPRAAREVGWTLSRLEGKEELPWWRVINNTGRISIKSNHYSATLQKKLLEAEGVFINTDFSFQIEEYRWKPTEGVDLLLP